MSLDFLWKWFLLKKFHAIAEQLSAEHLLSEKLLLLKIAIENPYILRKFFQMKLHM